MGAVGLGTMFRVGDRGIGFVGSSVGGHPCSMVKDLDRGGSGAYFYLLLRQLIGHAVEAVVELNVIVDVDLGG